MREADALRDVASASSPASIGQFSGIVRPREALDVINRRPRPVAIGLNGIHRRQRIRQLSRLRDPDHTYCAG